MERIAAVVAKIERLQVRMENRGDDVLWKAGQRAQKVRDKVTFTIGRHLVHNPWVRQAISKVAAFRRRRNH